METTFNCMADSTVSPRDDRGNGAYEARHTQQIENFKPWRPKLCGKKFLLFSI